VPLHRERANMTHGCTCAHPRARRLTRARVASPRPPRAP
jgi:hypothetical protein